MIYDAAGAEVRSDDVPHRALVMVHGDSEEANQAKLLAEAGKACVIGGRSFSGGNDDSRLSMLEAAYALMLYTRGQKSMHFTVVSYRRPR